VFEIRHNVWLGQNGVLRASWKCERKKKKLNEKERTRENYNNE
jgi:hypothetical protein